MSEVTADTVCVFEGMCVWWLKSIIHIDTYLPLSLSLSCSVFLLDRVSHELVAKVFDGGVVNEDEVCLCVCVCDCGSQAYVSMLVSSRHCSSRTAIEECCCRV